MASTIRLSSSALRASLRAPGFASRSTAFNAARCYSAKTQVCNIRSQFSRALDDEIANHFVFMQTLKERFAELLPEKIDEIKTLRK